MKATKYFQHIGEFIFPGDYRRKEASSKHLTCITLQIKLMTKRTKHSTHARSTLGPQMYFGTEVGSQTKCRPGNSSKLAKLAFVRLNEGKESKFIEAR